MKSLILKISSILLVSTFFLSPLAYGGVVNSSDISWDSSTGVQSIAAGSYNDLFVNNGIGLAIAAQSGQTPSVIWNLATALDLTKFSYRSQLGSNFQGAVSGFKLDFFDDASGAGTLLGTLNAVQNVPGSLLSWDLTSLFLSGVKSFEFTMLTREPISSGAIPGNHYEMGYMELEGESTPVPTPEPGTLMLMLVGLLGLRSLKGKAAF